MAKRYTSVLGIDIGSKSVKVAEVRLQGRQPVVTALGSAETPQGTVDHMGVHDVESIAFAVKQAIADSGASVGDAVFSLAGQGAVVVRMLEVPNMSDGELKQHMEWEITRNVPFAESTVESDFKAYPPADPAAQNLDVVMAISTRTAVDTLAGIAKKAGKKVAALDVEPLALLRVLSTGYQGSISGKQVCIVDVGNKTTSINMYRDDRLTMPRLVPIGGEMFTRAIADQMGMSFEDAEVAKRNDLHLPSNAAAAAAAPTQALQSYNPFAVDADSGQGEAQESAPVPAAVESDGGGRMFQAIAQPLDEFVSEVRRSIDYFRSKGGDVDLIMVCGGGSNMKNLENFLSSATGIATERLDPSRGVQMSAKNGASGESGSSVSDYAVAIGNGLHICY